MCLNACLLDVMHIFDIRLTNFVLLWERQDNVYTNRFHKNWIKPFFSTEISEEKKLKTQSREYHNQKKIQKV